MCLSFGLTLPHSNICHGSDTVENANKEIALWFEPSELVDWTPVANPWIYE